MTERVELFGWKNCWRLSNSVVDLVITGDVGPRIIRFGFLEQRNEFHVFAQDAGHTGGDAWHAYGGHRLWHAPEDPVRTYVPDNAEVAIEPFDGGLRATQAVEPLTGIEKRVEVRLAADAPCATVTHILRNAGDSTVKLAPWALTVMPPGGAAIIPLPPRGSHPQDLLPSSRMTLWPYTDLSDSRWRWRSECVLLRQEPNRAAPQKAGFHGGPGWIAYLRDAALFAKRIDPVSDAEYPDLGSSIEAFTNAEMLELETLGPLATLRPGEQVTHVEHWMLRRGAPTRIEDLTWREVQSLIGGASD